MARVSRIFILWLTVPFPGIPLPVCVGGAADPVPEWAEEMAPVQQEDPAPGLPTKILWYLPNRALDLLDVFRLRAKVGPGLGAGARVTDVASFYAGRSHAVYAGPPGPRHPDRVPALIGLEQKRGLVILGVDATDSLLYPPEYSFDEIGLDVHLLFLGAEVGVSPAEGVDFLYGWFGSDPRGDDLPRSKVEDHPPREGVLGHDRPPPPFPLDPKPSIFPSFTSRLDYLRHNVPRRVRGEFRAWDRWLLEPEQIREEQPPVRDLRLSLHSQWVSGPGGGYELKPKLKLHVDLPNLERELSLFIESSYDDDLPGTDEVDRRDKGWTLGARKALDKADISADIGVHTGGMPELFSRVAWKPDWRWGDWPFGFEQRLFWENEDGFGLLSALYGYRWLGRDDDWMFRTLTAGRFSESTVGFEWQQSFQLGHMTRLLDEADRRKSPGFDDTLECVAFKTSVFGNDRHQSEYRATVLFRRNLYDDFVLFEMEPGAQWREDRDWTTQYRLDLGLILIF